MDKATLNISVDGNFDVEFYAQTTECTQCSLWWYRTVRRNRTVSVVTNSTYSTILQFRSDDGQTEREICSMTYHFGEHGKYLMNITGNDHEHATCHMSTIEEPVNSELSILWAVMLYVGLAILWLAVKKIWRWRFHSEAEDERLVIADLGSPQDIVGSLELRRPMSIGPTNLRNRLLSLDTFRGICIVVMIFVNYGGGGFYFFKHSIWNGLTVADLVFPWFLWIMGASMAFSIRSHLRRSTRKLMIFWKTLKRALIMFTLGILVNQLGRSTKNTSLAMLRIPGVLQRFSISYLFVSTLHLIFARPTNTYQSSGWNVFSDILPFWPEWIVAIILIVMHTVITFLLQVPDCDKGYLGPGGLHMNGEFTNCTGGAAGYIDRLVFGVNHIHQTPTFKAIYDTKVPYDPEGILGNLTTIFIVFLGLQAGKILVCHKRHQARVIRWIIWGFLLGVIGTVLCLASKNDGWIPVNKNLWSVSYVLVTASMAYFSLSICYIVQDVKKWWTGAPFYCAGMNSIALYVGHEVTNRMFPFFWGKPEQHTEMLYMNLWGTSVWVLLSIWMYQSNFFIAL